MDDLTIYREAACEAARRGAAVLEEWRGRFQVREKAWEQGRGEPRDNLGSVSVC
jgi:hypothetical protein